MQWTFTYPTDRVSSLVVTAGPAAAAAGKTVQCATNAPGTQSCIAYGLNSNLIRNGVVAVATAVASASATISVSGALGASALAAPLAETAAGATLTVTGAAPPQARVASLRALACGATSLLAGKSTTCTVSLSTAAPSGGIAIAITSSTLALQAPSGVQVPAGATAATFAVTAGTVTANTSAVLTANLNGVGTSASVLLSPASAADGMLRSFACLPARTESGSTTCSVTLSEPAAAPIAVTLTKSNTAVQIPASVTIVRGAVSAAFTAATDAPNQSATLWASLAGATLPATVTLRAPRFELRTTRAELSGTANGAAITPAAAPAGLAGKLIVRGTGSVSFTPMGTGSGVTFRQSGSQNTNTAFYSFVGSPVGAVFNPNGGEIAFSLRSNHSFEQRKAMPQRYVFDVYAASQRLFFFVINVTNGRLVFSYSTGSTAGTWYYIPQGQENTVFGQGVTATIRLSWDGVQNRLYVNGKLVHTAAYAKASPSWTSASSFSVGATDVHSWNGGFQALDDVLGGFVVQQASPASTPASSVTQSSSTAVRSLAAAEAAPALTDLTNAVAGTAGNVCSPGGLATVTGSDLADTITANPSGADSSLGGVQVLVNGGAAPLIHVSPQHVTFVCPVAASGTPLDVIVQTANATARTSIGASMAAHTPGILSASSDGSRVVIRAAGLGADATAGNVYVVAGGHEMPVESLEPVSDIAGVWEVIVRLDSPLPQNATVAVGIREAGGDTLSQSVAVE